MEVTDGVWGDTEIATPLVHVDPGAFTELAFSEHHATTAGDAAIAAVPLVLAHWRSNASGLR